VVRPHRSLPPMARWLGREHRSWRTNSRSPARHHARSRPRKCSTGDVGLFFTTRRGPTLTRLDSQQWQLPPCFLMASAIRDFSTTGRRGEGRTSFYASDRRGLARVVWITPMNSAAQRAPTSSLDATQRTIKLLR
jgi:hypothetical protein